jgi:putative molybdopterin biosynthesis protein
MTLEVLAQYLMEQGIRLVSSNVGSLGGLFSLSRGECHFCGSHLLDPRSGTYNESDIHKVFPEEDVTVMSWVHREQGLLVRKGNPKRITSLVDLTRKDIQFVNRQRGAGTRVLLDHELKQINLHPEQIQGYNLEEYTHLGVAVAVSSGRADCGLGIAAAAKALELGFVPLFKENYELVFSKSTITDKKVSKILDIVREPVFKQEILKLPGYRLGGMGELRVITPDK